MRVIVQDDAGNEIMEHRTPQRGRTWPAVVEALDIAIRHAERVRQDIERVPCGDKATALP